MGKGACAPPCLRAGAGGSGEPPALGVPERHAGEAEDLRAVDPSRHPKPIHDNLPS